MAKNRNIPQAIKDNVLHYINQVYDEAYELGYQHGKRQGESDIEKTQRMIEDAVQSLQELVRTPPEDFVTDMWDRARLYIKVYADNPPQDKAEKIYQICRDEELKEVVSWLQEYAEPDDIPCNTCEYFHTAEEALPCCECMYAKVSKYRRSNEQK